MTLKPQNKNKQIIQIKSNQMPSEFNQTTDCEGLSMNYFLSNPPIIIRVGNFCCCPGKHWGISSWRTIYF